MSDQRSELQESAQTLLDAAMAYWQIANRAGIYGAVIWLEGTNGELLIMTRGEYRTTLMANIRETTPRTLAFGSASAPTGEGPHE